MKLESLLLPGDEIFMRKTIVRVVGSAAALAVPAAIGLGGFASADTFNGHSENANKDGVSSMQTTSSTGGHGDGNNGGVSYDHSWQHAGPHGASSSGTHASTGDNGKSGHGHGGGHGGLINIRL